MNRTFVFLLDLESPLQSTIRLLHALEMELVLDCYGNYCLEEIYLGLLQSVPLIVWVQDQREELSESASLL